MLANVILVCMALCVFIIPAMAIKVAIDDMKSSKND